MERIEDGSGGQDVLRILGIGGSMRRNSKSRILLAHALHLAKRAGAATTLADVRALDLPLYDDDRQLDDYPPSLTALLADARAADAYILCSPTYHGTMSGAVKNALDALNFLYDDEPRYFAGKPVALMALGGAGGNVLTSLQHAAHALNGVVVPTTVVASGGAVQDGDLVDERLRTRTRAMVDELLGVAARLKQPLPLVTASTR